MKGAYPIRYKVKLKDIKKDNILHVFPLFPITLKPYKYISGMPTNTLNHSEHTSEYNTFKKHQKPSMFYFLNPSPIIQHFTTLLLPIFLQP